MARTKSIAFLLILMMLAAGCGLAGRARVRLARLMTCHLFAIRNDAVLTQSTFHKHDVVAPRIGSRKAVKARREQRKRETITGPIELASLHLPAATAGVSNERSVLCVARDRLQQPRERVFRRYVIVTGSASNPSVGG
ncbi:MAG TPA: hypothetical protein VGR02_22055 [Thermoanaerobaculia bacterium]|nr:hypothetical protein [Thermoanaerobaculia bacterium]